MAGGPVPSRMASCGTWASRIVIPPNPNGRYTKSSMNSWPAE